MQGLNNSNRSILILISALITAFLLAVPGACLAREQVIIFHAGSLTVPFAKMEKIFESRYPDIDIRREAGGSTKMAA